MGNHQHAASGIGQTQIHLAVLILKNAEAGNVLGKVVGVGESVVVADTEQDQQSRTDVAGNLVADPYLGPRNSLHHGAHNVLLLLLNDTNDS